MITQEFLSQCSDEQINKGVEWMLCKELSLCDHSPFDDYQFGYFNTLNYCTSPNDAWPIVEWIFNQDVTFAMNGGGIMTGNLGSKYGGIKLDIAAKLLRAAMEVYILMSVNK